MASSSHQAPTRLQNSLVCVVIVCDGVAESFYYFCDYRNYGSMHSIGRLLQFKAHVVQCCYWILRLWTRAERGICIRTDLLLEDEGFFLISIEN